jgi:hypothetical protein
VSASEQVAGREARARRHLEPERAGVREHDVQLLANAVGARVTNRDTDGERSVHAGLQDLHRDHALLARAPVELQVAGLVGGRNDQVGAVAAGLAPTEAIPAPRASGVAVDGPVYFLPNWQVRDCRKGPSDASAIILCGMPSHKLSPEYERRDTTSPLAPVIETRQLVPSEKHLSPESTTRRPASMSSSAAESWSRLALNPITPSQYEEHESSMRWLESVHGGSVTTAPPPLPPTAPPVPPIAPPSPCTPPVPPRAVPSVWPESTQPAVAAATRPPQREIRAPHRAPAREPRQKLSEAGFMAIL